MFGTEQREKTRAIRNGKSDFKIASFQTCAASLDRMFIPVSSSVISVVLNTW